jgi:succinate-acetate transporter protein
MPRKMEEQPRTDIRLQPLAAPSILGLYGFAGATFMVAAHMAHWFGGAQTNMVLWPFAALFGGLAQFLVGMWAYKTRDGVATAMHGTWGTFWMAFGILWLLVAAGKVTIPANGAAFPAPGFLVHRACGDHLGGDGGGFGRLVSGFIGARISRDRLDPRCHC